MRLDRVSQSKRRIWRALKRICGISLIMYKDGNFWAGCAFRLSIRTGCEAERRKNLQRIEISTKPSRHRHCSQCFFSDYQFQIFSADKTVILTPHDEILGTPCDSVDFKLEQPWVWKKFLNANSAYKCFWINSANYKWEPSHISIPLPDKAIVGGKDSDGSIIYVARAAYAGFSKRKFIFLRVRRRNNTLHFFRTAGESDPKQTSLLRSL